MTELRTDRLLLRRWLPSDRERFRELNADPVVMEHFPATLSAAESDATIDRIDAGIVERGFGFWALEELTTGRFLGFTGMTVPRFDAPFMPAIEVGWRLARDAWGHGFATEAARAAIAHGFDDLGFAEIVSFTTTGNLRSQAVMRRLGMTHDPAGDFDHPLVPDWPQRRHVLYRLRRTAWSGSAPPGPA